MANTNKAIFYPIIEGDIPAYYDNIVDLLAPGTAMAVKYNVTAATNTELDGHNTNIPVKIQTAYTADQAAQGATEAKDAELFLGKTDMLRELSRITKLANFEETDAETLGIRVIKTPVDLNTVKPRFSGITTLPDQIILDWVKASLDGVEIYGSSNGTTFTKLDRDNRSPYEDKRKNQTNNVPETRYYKMRYFKNDVLVGLESDVVKIVAQIY